MMDDAFEAVEEDGLDEAADEEVCNVYRPVNSLSSRNYYRVDKSFRASWIESGRV
jgi:hypothetical protein